MPDLGETIPRLGQRVSANLESTLLVDDGGGCDRLALALWRPKMREVLPEHVLRDAISDRMSNETTIRPGVFWARPVRCNRDGDGPNWRLAFDPGQVPQGYAQTWERIRHEFEDRYDMAEDIS
jgi:hypothetical protein